MKRIMRNYAFGLVVILTARIHIPVKARKIAVRSTPYCAENKSPHINLIVKDRANRCSAIQTRERSQPPSAATELPVI